ncbi:YceD family protein [Dermatophilus congolensis]|uniref:YceD family protein n=2 Tax=Dermatophilus congolensis TaxID=1863 RepID=UPI003C7E472E
MLNRPKLQAVKPLLGVSNSMTELDPHGPLVIDTRRLNRRAGSMVEDAFDAVAPSRIGTDVLGVEEGTPMHVDFRLESVIEGILVSGEMRARATGACVRCLDDIDESVDVSFQELFAYADRAARHEKVGDEDEDQRVIEGDLIDLEPVIVDAVVLSLPFQPVCDEDCPGLCSTCGDHLSEDPQHSHDQTDPRWAALAHLRQEVAQTSDGDTDPEKRN